MIFSAILGSAVLLAAGLQDLAAFSIAQESKESNTLNQDKIFSAMSDSLPAQSEQRAGKSLITSMEMIDPKRNPKPKRPMGNDIGIARVRSLPADLHRRSKPDHLETTVSIDLTMASSNASQQAQDEEEQEVSREIHQIIDSVPKVHAMPNMEFHKDPEQETINQRITEVARQLTEAAIRREYEASQTKLSHPAEILRRINLPSEIETLTEWEETEVASPVPGALEMTTQQQVSAVETSQKAGKSLDVSAPLPLVSHMPGEVSQLLVAEAPFVPPFMLNEGFQSPAQLIGPLLGGTLATDTATLQNMHRSPKSVPTSPLKPEGVRLPSFLKIVSPRYKFSTNDLVVSVPVAGGYLPAIVNGRNTWWTDPAYKEAVKSE